MVRLLGHFGNQENLDEDRESRPSVLHLGNSSCSEKFSKVMESRLTGRAAQAEDTAEMTSVLFQSMLQKCRWALEGFTKEPGEVSLLPMCIIVCRSLTRPDC